MKALEKTIRIAQCLELAILLEVSADKPGNVNLAVGFEGTNHTHFLASAVAAAPHFKKAAEQGVAVFNGKLKVTEVGVGLIIRDCVADINTWQSGGNTLLGTVLLLCPMAVAAGMSKVKNQSGAFELSELRENLRLVTECSTPEDAVAVYEAIEIAKPGGLGKAPDLDVKDPNSINRILTEKISLYKVFKIASNYDRVCSEWVKNYPITFEFAYPYLMEQIKENRDPSVAITHTFLKVLSEYPDTFIARKVGLEKAKEVSTMAGEVLRYGGLKTSTGREKLRAFDVYLRRHDSKLNPGTTADIIAAALALALLSGYRL
ncbi:MAG: triphosphoribosyl-dephospho-CoA synthase [Candidatus Bathyarchaeota archaeon]|nr:triphosphoribosyl-dephospho-CoA synthase [Candidatus Bathyarchaeota archaeon]MCX8176844.1 triphosphoribosyl-dephospho-CoA synthase [Candidatus Bathyarchaeota archaeon]MDW8193472.1 triphosphoribosyl-dephospho-CoA synthase [Nitrososphaerota archaeon]